MSRRALALGYLSALSCAMPAVAQSNAADMPNIRKLAYNYAVCVVKRHHKTASEAILANLDNWAMMEKYPVLEDAGCLTWIGFSGGMTFPADFYRYGLADALVNMDFAKQGDTDFSDRPPLEHMPMPSLADQVAALARAKDEAERAKIQRHYDTQMVIAWTSRYGECIVRRNPLASRYWLLSLPDTPEETDRINALRQTFSDCLDMKLIGFTRSTLRGTVALNYYRLAMAAKQPLSGSVH